MRATLLVVANAIGTGIFTTSGFALADLHDARLVFLVWIMGAVYSLIGVACYDQLHQIYPGSGGEYNFLSRALHPLFGHFAGWVSLIAGFSAPIAASSMAFALYMQKAFGPTLPPVLMSSLVILVIFIFHGFYSHTGFKVHDRFVWGKLICMVALIAIAALWAPWGGDTPLAFPGENENGIMGSIANSFFWIAYSYSGWNAVYYIASEVGGTGEEARKSVKRASFYGTICVCLLYLSLNAVLLFSSDVAPLVGSPEVVGTFLIQIFGASAAQWLNALIAFGLVSTASALFISGPRVYARMAEDGALPKVFKTEQGAIPRNATVLQAGLALLFLWSSQFDLILKFVGFSMALCSIFSVAILVFFSPSKQKFWVRALALIFCVCTSWLVLKAVPGNIQMVIGVAALVALSTITYTLQKLRKGTGPV